MKGLSVRVLAVLTILSMLLSLLPGTAIAAPSTPEGASRVESSADAYLNKISPDLREAALSGSTQKVQVLVFAQPGTKFGTLLERPLTRKLNFDGLRITSGWVSEAGLLKLAGLSGVDAIINMGPGVIPPPPVDNEGTKPKLNRSAGAPAKTGVAPTAAKPSLWHGRDVMGAARANAAGFDGNGVIVSVNDTGIDFGHPDLQGTQARETDPASPYYGWPLVADGSSIVTYLTSGSTAGTSYADTTSTFHYPTGTVTGTVDIFNGVMTHTITFRNTSKSGVYHYGWHPDFSLGYVEGPDDTDVSPMILVVDENTAGVYDTVYVDLGNGLELTYDFINARPARKGHEEVWADLTGDGIADVSGGMIYWIADGTHFMPGADVLFDLTGFVPPGNGDLVAFFGDYNQDSHGTGVASQVVAQGVITSQFGQGYNVPNLPGVTSDGQVAGGVLRGMAPKARLFGAYWGDAFDNWILAALGYDGLMGTADDAQIITNSWGYLSILPGWDYYSRLVTFVVQRINPYTTILAAAGNGGYGYGIMDTHGASSSVLTVGASTQYGTDDGFSIISDTTQITFDDIIYYSNRGPNGLGQAKPQVTCIGNSASGAHPLNLSVSPFTGFYDGQTAWYEFGGTSQATPICAGVLADVVQAYKMRTGSWPTYLQATRLLMSGADNLNYDTLTQGAGRANADRSTRIAAWLEGVYVSPSQWTAGNYRGTTYEAFSHIMFPGTASSQVFSITNWNMTNPMTVSITSDYLVKISEVITDFTTQPMSQESNYTFRKPDYLWRIDPMIPEDTDLMEINVYSPYGEFSFGDPTVPSTQKSRGDNAWYSRVYNWTDWNHNGVLWTDSNGSGTVNPGELDEPATDPLTEAVNPNISLELNQLNEGNNSANTLQLRVQKPLERMTDGLWFGLVHRVRSTTQPQTHLQIKYTFYKHVAWPWLTTDMTTLTVPPSSTVSFTATMTIPPTTTLGLYEGAIRVVDEGQPELTTVIPVVVNVAANTTDFTYSSPNGSDQIFDNGRVFGGYDWRGNGWYPQGDWRQFFTDVPDDAELPANSRFLVQATWVYTPTDIDILAYGRGDHYCTIPVPTPIVGPYNLVPTGGSPQTVHSTGTGNAYTFRTSSGGATELITAKLQAGLNEFMLHNVLYNGPASGEPFTLTVGTAALNPASIAVTTTQAQFAVPMSFVASLDLPNGLQALGFGLSRPTVYDNQFVATGANNYYTFTVNTAGLLTLRTEPTGSNYDIDLYLERFSGTTWVPYAQSGGPDAYESIQVTLPPNGTYRARVNGYDVPGPTYKYRLTIDILQGTDVTVTGLPTGPISAGTTVTFTANLNNLNWVGQRSGILYVGPAGSPTAFSVPIVVTRPTMTLYMPYIVVNNTPTP